MTAVRIGESVFANFFDDLGNREVFLLSDEEAEQAWITSIDARATSYFDLPDASWVVSSPQRSVGNWINAYNSSDRPAGATLLKRAVDWPDNAIVVFLVNRSIALRADWITFCCLWDDFLAVDDDCPILARKDSEIREALLFRPLGDIAHIKQPTE